MILSLEQRSKLDAQDDTLFYSFPRLVTHVDDGFIEHLTQLYRQVLQPNSRILDLMSSWVSHLPPDMQFSYVAGHGLNEEELAQNPRLDHYWVQNLNENSPLPCNNGEFDAVLMAVSVQYLQFPEQVFAEIYRVLAPQGVCIVSFSNRMFYQKAIQAWRDSSDRQHIQLVKTYFRAVPGFTEPQTIQHLSDTPVLLRLMD
jgi:SAM-dependent methyltransferase